MLSICDKASPKLCHFVIVMKEVSQTEQNSTNPWISVLCAEVGKVTLKSNGDEAFSDEFLFKSNGDEALTLSLTALGQLAQQFFEDQLHKEKCNRKI